MMARHILQFLVVPTSYPRLGDMRRYSTWPSLEAIGYRSLLQVMSFVLVTGPFGIRRVYYVNDNMSGVDAPGVDLH